MLDLAIKYNSFEIRACDEHLGCCDKSKNSTLEVVKWNKNSDGKDYCFTIAFFKRCSEGYELKFVGDRPFRHIPINELISLWNILKFCQSILNDYFESEIAE